MSSGEHARALAAAAHDIKKNGRSQGAPGPCHLARAPAISHTRAHARRSPRPRRPCRHHSRDADLRLHRAVSQPLQMVLRHAVRGTAAAGPPPARRRAGTPGRGARAQGRRARARPPDELCAVDAARPAAGRGHAGRHRARPSAAHLARGPRRLGLRIGPQRTLPRRLPRRPVAARARRTCCSSTPSPRCGASASAAASTRRRRSRSTTTAARSRARPRSAQPTPASPWPRPTSCSPTPRARRPM